MRFDKIIYCDYDVIKEFPAKYVEEGNTVSIVSENYELMLFISKNKELYEARVYKNSSQNKYQALLSDEIISYEENDKFVSFYFDNYYSARRFMDYLPFSHKEFRERPAREIKRTNYLKYDSDMCNVASM